MTFIAPEWIVVYKLLPAPQGAMYVGASSSVTRPSRPPVDFLLVLQAYQEVCNNRPDLWHEIVDVLGRRILAQTFFQKATQFL